MEKNGTFTFKTHSKFKTPGSSSNSGLFQPFKTNIKPVAAVVPNPVRSRTKIPSATASEEPTISQFNLDEDDLWNDDLIAEAIKNSSSQEGELFQDVKESPKHNVPSTDNSHTKPLENKKAGTPLGKHLDHTLSTDEETNDELDLERKLLDAGLKPSSSPVRALDFTSIGVPTEFFEPYSPEFVPPSPVKTANTAASPATSNGMEWNKPPSELEKLVLKAELKPLGINAQTDAWLEEIIQNPAFYKITDETPVSALRENLDFLNRSYVAILEKVMTTFEVIPLEILSKFPDFDPDVFLTLRSTRRRIKAKIIQTENVIKRNPATSSVLETPEKRNTSYERENTFSHGGRSIAPPVESPRMPDAYDCRPSTSTFDISSVDASTSWNVQTPKAVNRSERKTSQSPSKHKSPKKSGSSTYVDYTDLLYKTPTSKGGTSSSSNSSATMRNDGASGEFDGLGFPFSRDMMDQFALKFGLKNFRTNQLQVVNAALLGHDCFVLMPTGGGKSLCYQLPAVVSPGVTVVISPLRSLILDQVTKLLTLDIPAAHLSGDMKDSEASKVYNKLNQAEPGLKLLYVTPEKLTASPALRGCLTGLYKRGKLARFVIDEVHCVSQWGHDFRPDYKKLKDLRQLFPSVKIMALTATATPRVRLDILHQLQITNPKWFLSSFNRSNLIYSVREKKGSNAIKEIASLIQKNYRNDTGVIYCFSRKECEDVARELRACGVNSVPYHAGLPDEERTRTQTLWMNDKAKVVCATIAFGMGIDKLDVRFVIHYSLPKSIEGYYQESGRAGRDGDPALCILFYAHRDKQRILKLIHLDQSQAGAAARKVHVDNLFRMVAFAENRTDCRRALQLEYFGEKFDRKLCLSNRSTACDNCLHQGEYDMVDVSNESRAIVTAVKQICGTDDVRGCNFTMLHFVDIFKGSTVAKVMNEGHNTIPLYGMGKTWTRLDVERLFRKLINDGYLRERMIVKDEGITLAYLKPGQRADDLLKISEPLNFHMKKRRVASEAPTAAPVTKQLDPAMRSIHENCYEALRDVLKGIAEALNVNTNAIMNMQALRAMAASLPETPEEMLAINHVTQANFDKYGAALLDVTLRFAEQRKQLTASQALSEPQPDEQENDWLTAGPSHESPYFESDITFVGRGRGNKRRRGQGGSRRGAKRARGAGNWSRSRSKSSGSQATSRSSFRSSSSSTRAPSTSSTRAPSTSSRPAAAAQFSTLMELPTSKSRFPRPKAFLSNL